jgi:cytochrome c553
MKRSAPLKRTGFSRKGSPKPFALADRATTLRRTAIKSRTKKPTVAEGSKYLAACQGEPCYARIVGVCWGDTESVVPAHSNQAKHGKSMGRKADHIFTVPMCFACHQWTDQGKATREQKFAAWDAAYAEWEPVRARKLGIEVNQLEAA